MKVTRTKKNSFGFINFSKFFQLFVFIIVVLILLAIVASVWLFYNYTEDENLVWLDLEQIKSVAMNESEGIFDSKAKPEIQNLVDGNYSTGAASISGEVDYIVELKKEFDVRKIEVVWNEVGTQGRVKEWYIFAKSNGDWEPIFESKERLLDDISVIKTEIKTNALRIVTKRYWPDRLISVFEFKIFIKEVNE